MIRRLRRYPGETAARAIARASHKSWWPMRTHDDPAVTPGGRWCWTTTEQR